MSSPAKPSVLFICVKNGGKSQMAAALMRHVAGDAVEVYSAGTQPGVELNALSTEVIAEVGVDMTAESPKPIDPALLQHVDRVIVLGDEAQVTPVAGMTATIETWQLDEPSIRGIDGIDRMRLVRDEIDDRIQRLLPELQAEQSPRPSVLFVCVHNAGRSQMAAAYLEHLAAGVIAVRSAGSVPADDLNPVAVAAMAEDGIDITAATPQVLTPEAVEVADVVITMGCGDACPIYPGKRYEDWELDDPAGQPLETVRGIRDDIKRRVTQLLHDLTSEQKATR